MLVLGSPAEVRRSAGAATIEEAFRTIVLENRSKEGESKSGGKPLEKPLGGEREMSRFESLRRFGASCGRNSARCGGIRPSSS